MIDTSSISGTRTLGLVLLAAAGLTLPLGLSAQDADADTILQHIPYEVGTAQPPIEPGTTLTSMTVDQAIDRALESNLDLQSARLSPEIQAYSLGAAEAAFNPTFNATFGHNSSTNQSTSQLDGGQQITTDRNTFNFSLSQPMPWYGGQLSANFNNARTSTDNIFATRNPNYNSTLNFSYTQPLLAGRRIDNQRNQVRTQQVQRQIVDVQLQGQIDNITAQVRVAYWNLRSQIEQIEIQRRNLAQAEQLLANNRIRVEQGTMVPMELAQAEAQVASAEQALLNAEIQWRNQERNFKQLIAGGSDDPIFQATINPVDRPEVVERDVDIEAAVARALQNRPEVLQQSMQRQISEMNLEVSRDNVRPDLNLSASYSLQGVGGDLFERDGLGGTPELIQAGGYGDALSSIGSLDTPTFNVSLNFSYPLGTRASELNLEQARLQLRQTDMALAAQELAISTEVTNAGMAVSNTFLQLEAARRSREAAERSVEAELTRFQVGASTNFQVATAQDNLTQMRLSELQAIINHVNAIAEFERVQGLGWNDL